MNEKLKRLALRLVDEVPSNSSPQQTYDILINVWKNQFDYFNHFDSSFLIKLVIYVYCLSSNKTLEQADKIINNISFLVVFESTDNYYEDECSNCGGDGNIRCDMCGGYGDVDCESCRGNGSYRCSECRGSGEINGESCDECEGKGQIDCTNCDSTGKVICGHCGGEGYDSCTNCDGSGYEETNELVLEVKYICTWNKQLKSLSEIKCGNPYEVLIKADSYEDFYSNESIILELDEIHQEFDDQPDDSVFYCVKSSDEPNIIKSRGMKLIPFGYITDIGWN